MKTLAPPFVMADGAAPSPIDVSLHVAHRVECAVSRNTGLRLSAAEVRALSLTAAFVWRQPEQNDPDWLNIGNPETAP